MTDATTPDEDLVNKFRLAKGDLLVATNGRGKISHAIPSRLTVIKEYIRREVFPYHYEIYGMGFLELQNAFRSPTRAKCSSVLLEQWGIGASKGFAAAMYMGVCRKVGQRRIGQVEFFLETPERRKTNVAVKKDRRLSESLDDFDKSFIRLVEIMDEERERLKEIIENNS